jgi:enterochelin esterase-like enzyme
MHTHSHVTEVGARRKTAPVAARDLGIVIGVAAGHYVPMSAESAVVMFGVPDPEHELAGARLVQDVRIPGDQLDFSYRDDHWELSIARPPVNRMEYLLELRRPDGSTQTVLDPGNPRQVDGAFGHKSVLEFSSYAAPAWLTAQAKPGSSQDLEVRASQLGTAVSVRIWSPADAPDDEPLPLLVANDGPEYDSLASLTRYLSAGMTGKWLPRLRAALVDPGSRDRWYSANLGYARALRHAVIPALISRVATKARIGMGTSLGGLAMLHAHCRFPDAFDALFCQSGSFFTERFDSQERQFPYYRRIVSFVSGVHRGRLPGRPIPVSLTCGAIEENAENNRLIAATLAAHGYPVILREVPDMHNYTAWRDAFDPYLTELLWQACS